MIKNISSWPNRENTEMAQQPMGGDEPAQTRVKPGTECY